MLTNLLENAIRHAPKGTPSTIGAAPQPPDAVAVFVADHGPGVSPEQRDEMGLPDMDGVEVCRRVRTWSQAPIVVLSADSIEDRKVEALAGTSS